VGNDFSVGLRNKNITFANQINPQRIMIFNDAVTDNRDRVRRGVRVCVNFARLTVRGPASVGDAGCSGQAGIRKRVIKFFNLANATNAFKIAGLQYRDSRGIISAIFKALQSLDENDDSV